MYWYVYVNMQYTVVVLNIFNSAQVLINSTGELFAVSSSADTITARQAHMLSLEWVTRLGLLGLHIPTQRL